MQVLRFNSILVRLKGKSHTQQLPILEASFNSILVRLKGFTETVVILYAILTGRVKTIFMIVVFKAALLSTYSRVNSLGGRRFLTRHGFTRFFTGKWQM